MANATHGVPHPMASVSTISFGQREGRLHLRVRVVDAADHPLGARIAVQVLHRGESFARASGRTTSAGWFSITARPRLGHGETCYTAHVTAVGAPGYHWDHKNATKFFCLYL